MIPPPTPVPSVTMTRSWHPLPAPSHISPRARHIGVISHCSPDPVSSSASRFTSYTPSPGWRSAGQCRPLSQGQGSRSRSPAPGLLRSLFSLRVLSRDSAMSGRIASPSLSVLVGISHLSTSVPSVWNRPILTVVPPISYSKAKFHLSCPPISFSYFPAPACTAPARHCSPSFSDGN